MRLLSILLYLILIFLGISFAVLNASLLSLNLYFTTIVLPISLLLTLMLGFGLIIGFILGWLKYLRLKVAFRKLQYQLKLSEKEIKNLRQIPLVS